PRLTRGTAALARGSLYAARLAAPRGARGRPPLGYRPRASRGRGGRRVLERADREALVAHKRERPARVLLELEALLASAQKQGFALVALACTLETKAPPGEALASVLAHLRPARAGAPLAAHTARARDKTRAGRPPR